MLITAWNYVRTGEIMVLLKNYKGAGSAITARYEQVSGSRVIEQFFLLLLDPLTIDR